MPSAAFLVEEGYELKSMDAKLLQQIEWLARHYKRCCATSTYIGACVTNQFVCIGCHKTNFVFVYLEKHTAHDGAHVIVACCKQCLIDRT